MVKVLGFDDSVAKKATCRGCGAVNAYYENDIKEYHGKDYSGGSDGREYIHCGNCNKTITLRSW